MDAAILQSVDRMLAGDEAEFRKMARERLGVLSAAASSVLPDGDELTAAVADALQSARGRLALVKSGVALDDLLAQQALQAARRRVASGAPSRHPLDWKPAEGAKTPETGAAFTPEALSRFFVQGNLPPEGRSAFNSLLESDPSFAKRVLQVVGERFGPASQTAPAGMWEKIESKLPALTSLNAKTGESDSRDAREGFLTRILNFEDPGLQFRILAIMLGAIVLTALCLVFWRSTGTSARAPVSSEAAETTYVGLEPDVPPVGEVVPTVPPRVAAPAPRARKTATGRQWVERADSAKIAPVTATSDAPRAAPPIRSAAPKEYVPGDPSEFLSEIKVSASPVPSNP